jgi:hypothetical protein
VISLLLDIDRTADGKSLYRLRPGFFKVLNDLKPDWLDTNLASELATGKRRRKTNRLKLQKKAIAFLIQYAIIRLVKKLLFENQVCGK